MPETPSWPSLYNPATELLPITHRSPVQPGASYLHRPQDVFRFTLYWTFVLNIPAFVLCGTYAFLNLSFAPRRPLRKGQKRPLLSHVGSSRRSAAESDSIPLRRYERQVFGASVRVRSQFRLPSRSPAKQNEGRSRLTFALLVLLWFATFALGGAVIGSAVIGYVLAGLFKVAQYNMSTWIPLLGALMQTLVGFLALWPTVIDII